MPMPKGHKSKNGYATVQVEGGMGYREIAEYMTEKGDEMNHSTARNVFLRAMKKVAKDACSMSGLKLTDKEISKIAADPRFQSGLIEIINDDPGSISL
tara:strand:- start:161 stop:454 length:294 start_codon:yes stop_codon:yes gene_type:complete